VNKDTYLIVPTCHRQGGLGAGQSLIKKKGKVSKQKKETRERRTL
jgi:hypothetical protein